MQTITCSRCRKWKPRAGSVGGSRGQPRVCAGCAQAARQQVRTRKPAPEIDLVEQANHVWDEAQS